MLGEVEKLRLIFETPLSSDIWMSPQKGYMDFYDIKD